MECPTKCNATILITMMRACVRVPIMVLSGGDREGGSLTSRPQEHVSSLALLLEQQLSLQTRHTVVTAAVSHKTERGDRQNKHHSSKTELSSSL